LGTVAGKNKDRHFSFVSDLTELTVNISDPIGIKRGYRQGIDPEWTFPDEKGQVQIEMEEVSRIELHLNGKKSQSGIENLHLSDFEGYLVVGEQLRPLPIGSTLDKKQGIFYWMPGAGFIGEYDLIFVRKSRSLKDQIRVKINVLPEY